MTRFEQKFGKDFLSSVPLSPGVYRIFDSDQQIIYVGKAKCLRRRLAQYRKPKRLKKHKKMRTIIAQAARIEFEVCTSEVEASLLELSLIQELRPSLNIAG